MDVVSDAVATIRTGRPRSARTHLTAPWGLRFTPTSGPGFHVVLEGGCWLLSRDAAPVALAAGDVVFVSHGQEIALADHPSRALVDATEDLDDAWIPRSEIQRAEAATVLICGSYQLSRARPHPLLAELPDVIHLPARVSRQAPLSAVVALLGDELDERNPGSDAIVSGLLDTMLLYILRTWYKERAQGATTGWAAALSDPAVSTALHHLHRDPVHPWTVEELGARAGLSRAAFARRFTTLVGKPPLTYLAWWRMTSAGALLRLDDTPLHTIARLTGYTSESAFNRAFKREYGKAPGEYRREHLHPHAESPAKTSPATGR
ncbi:AraC family transcriptional regulator [Streptomyces sp. NBC_00872]|uniref:AraC family transcriptional regulator n=1 Tax=Streptomyces sp. NBC_00872 TaxID=2903686 RepID=UPI003865B1C9|nr:AraC family transcriptional regulator [Streptomyces sp. NBC_00872]